MNWCIASVGLCGLLSQGSRLVLRDGATLAAAGSFESSLSVECCCLRERLLDTLGED